MLVWCGKKYFENSREKKTPSVWEKIEPEKKPTSYEIINTISKPNRTHTHTLSHVLSFSSFVFFFFFSLILDYNLRPYSNSSTARERATHRHSSALGVASQATAA